MGYIRYMRYKPMWVLDEHLRIQHVNLSKMIDVDEVQSMIVCDFISPEVICCCGVGLGQAVLSSK